MSQKIISPLTEIDLTGAAYLCLEEAAMTDLDQFPPEVAYRERSWCQERRRRFEQALAKTQRGATSLAELGLLAEDCEWAISRAPKVGEQFRDGWLGRFQMAANVFQKTAAPEIKTPIV